MLVPVFLLSLSTTFGLTVSGLSSGAFFSSQFHVAYSASVKGAAIVAGGPYYCSQGTQTTATTACMSVPLMINLNACLKTATDAAASGKIDPLSNLASTNVYIYSGSKDTVVNPGVVKQTVAFYSKFVTSGRVVSNFTTPSEHAWISNSYGKSCSYLGSPYMNNCNLDTAGIILNQFYAQLNPRGSMVESNLVSFSQATYGDVAKAVMGKTGYVYVPSACKSTKCELHIAFHGCQQSVDVVGKDFVMYTGLNDWAESNNIVVLYPQATSSIFKNPEGCWDWWGYTGSNFAFKSGLQMSIVYAMYQKPPGVSWDNLD